MSRPTVVRCPCGQVLAELTAGLYIIRHRGREIVTREPEAIRCEACGAIWRPSPQDRAVMVH